MSTQKLIPDTVFINGGAIAALFAHVPEVQALVYDRTGEDISDDRTREVLVSWLLSCIDDWCEDVAEHLLRDPGHWDEFKEKWKWAENLEEKAQRAAEEKEYYHLAA